MATVKLANLRKSFGSADVIRGVDIEIAHGEFVVFVGPSGCGKSTLLRMIAGLEDITSGDLPIDGARANDMQPRERDIGVVFRSYANFPHMSVADNIGFGLTIAGVPKAEKAAKVLEAAKILKMEHLLERKPSQLPGGQRRRVAIGRLIVRQPKVFLFDEPLSNLDAALRMDMRMEIGKLHQDLGATMIYVTHDQVEAMTPADKIVVLKDGIVQQIGAPLGLYHRPANLFVAGFIGSPKMNFIPVTMSDVQSGQAKIAADGLAPIVVTANGAWKAGDKAVLAVRPQYLSVAAASGEGQLHGTVSLVERLGTDTIVNVERADGKKKCWWRSPKTEPSPMARRSNWRSISPKRCCSSRIERASRRPARHLAEHREVLRELSTRAPGEPRSRRTP